jgi:hypothetical protein
MRIIKKLESHFWEYLRRIDSCFLDKSAKLAYPYGIKIRFLHVMETNAINYCWLKALWGRGLRAVDY